MYCTMYHTIIDHEILIHTDNYVMNFLPKINSDISYYFNDFFSLIKQFKFEDAIQECKRLQKLDKYIDIVFYNLGSIFCITENYYLAEKYYLMAIELNNSDAMCNLGYYHVNITSNYKLAKKYFLMAVELNNSEGMNSLGMYYMFVTKKYELAEKYFFEAIKLNNSDAMYNLGYYHHTITKIFELAEMYYLMAIELNNSEAMENLGDYYETIKQDYGNAIKYYKMGYLYNEKCALSLKKILDEHNFIAKYIEFLIKHNTLNNGIKECIICFDDSNVIQLECKHCICVNCINEVTKCYYCKIKFTDSMITHKCFLEYIEHISL